MASSASLRAALLSLLLALQLGLVSCQLGHAQFTDAVNSAFESSNFVVVALERVGGTVGELQADVTVLKASPGANFIFNGASVRWPDGDSALKPVVIRVLDDNVHEATAEEIWLTVNDTNPDPPAEELTNTTKVKVLSDNDGGTLVFSFIPQGKTKSESLLTDPAVVREGPSDLCLVYAERTGGRSGEATVALELDNCSELVSVPVATPVVDFNLHPARAPAVWGDGESDRRCLAYALFNDDQRDALQDYQVGLRVWQDADVESNELICLRVNLLANSTATVDTRLVRILINDQGPGGAGISECTKGADCIVNLTGLHFDVGDDIILSKDCGSVNCGEASVAGTRAAAQIYSINASASLELIPGQWFGCRCFLDEVYNQYYTQAIHLLNFEGPSDSNFATCVLGWPSCVVPVLAGEGPPDPTTSLRIMVECAKLGQPVEGKEAPAVKAMSEGGVAWQTAAGLFPMEDPKVMSAAGAGFYNLCWCKAVEGTNCSELEDFVVKAGLLMYSGPSEQQSMSVSMGQSLEVSISGTGLAVEDKLELKVTCDDSSGYLDTFTDDGYTYDFGLVTEDVIPPGRYSFCWCRANPADVIPCSQPEHWTLVGYLTVLCTGDFYDNSGVCNRCNLPWDGPDEDRMECEIYPDRLLAILAMFVFLTLAYFLLSMQVELTHVAKGGGESSWRVSGRRVHIEDISVETEGARLVATTLGSHFLRLGATFNVYFSRTNHFLLDGQLKRATVIDGSRLEIRNLDETFFSAEASGGFFVLSIIGTYWYSQACACFPLLLACVFLVAVGATSTSFAPPIPMAVLVVSMIQVAIALLMRSYRKSRQMPTPLDRRLRQYIRMIDSQNPNPKPGARGASRAVTAFRLFELYEYFQAFIKFRTMYYIDPNLVRPITKKHKLSFAERVGPQQVQFFISHWWGTPFIHFCESVRRHAVQISGSEDEHTWKLVSYWICTFSNNQYQIKEELGTYHKDSSFYLALHSGVCKGTAMIMDERASLLNRSWCLFELLQTVTLEKTQKNFTGLYFCTPTGVLNNGDATVELAMNIGKHITGLSLENATATSQEDKDMINKLVLEEMGSFRKIDQILRNHLAAALKTCQGMVDEQFDGLFAELRGTSSDSVTFGTDTVMPGNDEAEESPSNSEVVPGCGG